MVWYGGWFDGEICRTCANGAIGWGKMKEGRIVVTFFLPLVHFDKKAVGRLSGGSFSVTLLKQPPIIETSLPYLMRLCKRPQAQLYYPATTLPTLQIHHSPT